MNEDSELTYATKWLLRNKAATAAVATIYIHYYVLLFMASLFTYGLAKLKGSDPFNLI